MIILVLVLLVAGAAVVLFLLDAVGVGFVGRLRELSGHGGWWLESC